MRINLKGLYWTTARLADGPSRATAPIAGGPIDLSTHAGAVAQSSCPVSRHGSARAPGGGRSADRDTSGERRARYAPLAEPDAAAKTDAELKTERRTLL
jgi:hypothetical protein